MKRQNIAIILLAAVSFVSSCGGALKEVTDYTGDITGTVMSDGDPLSAVEVEMTPGGTTVFTNSYGTFSFNDVQAGSYKLTYTKDGYKSEIKNITVKAGETTTADVSMEIDGDKVTVDPEILDFGKLQNSLAITLSNKTGKPISWEVDKTKLPEWLTLSAYNDDIPSKGTNVVTAKVDRSRVDGESAKASIDIVTANSQTLAVKVTVEAGVVGEVNVYACAVEYDYFAVRFEMKENVAYFYAGADISFERPDEDIIKYGDKYIDDGYVVGFFCDKYPGQKFCLYVLPYNEFGQKGTMQKYEVPLKTEPSTEFTALKDITAAGTYNVENATVIAAHGNSFILSDDKGYHLFYAYFDDSSNLSRPDEYDIITIDGGSVETVNGILAFHNPPVQVTGKNDMKEYDYDTLFDYWKKNGGITTADEIGSYTTSLGVVPIKSTGILTSDGDSKNFSLAVGYGEATAPKVSIATPEYSKLSPYDSCYVSFFCYVVGKNESSGRLMVCPYDDMEEEAVSQDSYIGYWDATAYDVFKESSVSWEGTEIYAHSYDDGDWILISTWMYTDKYWHTALAKYNDKTGWIDVLGGWYDNSYYFYFDDPETTYYSVFFPIQSDENGNKFVERNGRYNLGGDDGVAVLKPSLNGDGTLFLTGDYLPDEDGRVANGFVFLYYKKDDDTQAGNFDVYKDVTFKPSVNYPKTTTASRRAPTYRIRKFIKEYNDVPIPLKRDGAARADRVSAGAGL